MASGFSHYGGGGGPSGKHLQGQDSPAGVCWRRRKKRKRKNFPINEEACGKAATEGTAGSPEARAPVTGYGNRNPLWWCIGSNHGAGGMRCGGSGSQRTLKTLQSISVEGGALESFK